jgi:predicted ATPase
MCKINTVFSAKELRALGPKERRALEKQAVHHVRTSPEIQKIISKHPKVRTIVRTKPDGRFRAAMRKKLRATFNKLKD